MYAQVGDHLVLRPRQHGHVKEGEILAVSTDGAPPYRVRWLHDGSEVRIIPGWDAYVEAQERRPDRITDAFL